MNITELGKTVHGYIYRANLQRLLNRLPASIALQFNL